MSVSKLNEHQRHIARDRACHAAVLSLHHAPQIHYTQGPDRWQGIAKDLDARKGQFPTEGDCSAMYTWWVGWNGLHLPFGLRDILNGDNWEGGYTGTLADHGREVKHRDNLLRGDAVLYGSGPPFDHVAMIIHHGGHGRTPLVISHGSESGPYLLPYNYRSDIGQFRRYI